MTDTPRRQLLRAIGGLTAITSLAGCSSLPGGDSGGDGNGSGDGSGGDGSGGDGSGGDGSGGDGSGGDSGPSEARTWLYDPTQWTDTPAASIRFEASSALAAERDHLHPNVREERSTPLYSVDLDPESTDWALFQRTGVYGSPNQTVYSGTFEEDVARSNIAESSTTEEPTLRDDGSIGDLQAVSDDEGFVGAYNDETIVGLIGKNSRSVVEDTINETNRLSAVDEDVVSLLDVLGFDHTFSVDLRMTPEDGWFAVGTAYRIEGERTRVRRVGLGHDWEEEDLRSYVSVEGTTVESVSSDGPVQWADVVAPTNRLGLNGMVFKTGLPFEESS